MRDAEKYRLEPCEPCAPFYVADATYTAECPAGQTGDPVTKRAQARSFVSVAHARLLALREAREQALAELVCVGGYVPPELPPIGAFFL